MPHSSVYLSVLAAINIAIAIAIAIALISPCYFIHKPTKFLQKSVAHWEATIMKLDTSDLQLTIICGERGLVQQVLINKWHENCCEA